MNRAVPRAEVERFTAALAEKRRRLAKAEHSVRGYRDEDGVWQGGLLSFVRYFWHVLEPGTPLVTGWVLEAICLPYQTQVMTRDGQKPIGDIVETKWQGEVLSFNHDTLKTEWKPIVHHMKSAGKPLIKIKYGAKVLNLTANHPIFTSEHGYVRADQITVGDTLWLHSLSKEIHSSSEPKPVLQPKMLVRQPLGHRESQKFPKLQTLRQRICEMSFSPTWWLLLNAMFWNGKNYPRKRHLSQMWRIQVVGSKWLSLLLCQVKKNWQNACLSAMRQGDLSFSGSVGSSKAGVWSVLRYEVPRNGISRQKQHLLCERKTSGKIPAGVLDRAPTGTEARKALLLSVFQKIKVGCASHRQRQNEQRVMESRGLVQKMPLRPARACVEGAGKNGSREIGWATVDSVECGQWIPDAVYNIEVADNNNYFAETVLVHNCEHLEAVTFGEVTNLLINVFPGAMKSMLTDVFWPAWEWGPMEMPHLRYVTFSYSSSLTERDNGKFKDLICSAEYQAMYGAQVQPRQVGYTKVSNYKHGFKLASSVGGVGTGQRGDRIIADDLNNVKESESQAVLEETNRWFRESMSSRLNNMETGAKILICQRVSEGDVSGEVLRLQLPYCHLMIQMEYEWQADENGDPYTTSIGWVDPRWRPTPEECNGELAWPERFPEQVVRSLKVELGPYASAAQLQQTPEARGGGLLKREWWQPGESVMTGDGAKFPPFSYVLASLDGAFTDKEENDPSALTIWGIFVNEFGYNRAMLVHAWAKRLQFSGITVEVRPGEHESVYRRRAMPNWGLIEWTADTCNRFKVDRLLIENKASGASAAQSLRNSHGRQGWAIELVEPSGDKVARVLAVQPSFSQGMIYAPDREWAEEVIDECAVFPKGRHDDLVDSTSQAIKHLRDSGLLRSDEDRRAEELEAVRHKGAPKKAHYPGFRMMARR